MDRPVAPISKMREGMPSAGIPALLNRREFLGIGLGAAALAADGEAMRFAISGNILWGQNASEAKLREGISSAARFHFQGIEPFRFNIKSYESRPQELKAMLDEAGLVLSTCSSGGDFVTPSAAKATIDDNFRFTRDFLKPLGCKHLKVNIGGAGKRPPGGTSDEDLKAVAHTANELGKRVNEELGIKMGFHPHIWSVIENEREMNRVLELTEAKYVGLVPDTAHLALAGMDPVKVLRQHYDRVVAVHLKDTEAKYRHWKGPTPTEEEHARNNLYRPLGTGGVDFLVFFRVLRERGYSYWVDLDFDPPRPGEGTVDQNLSSFTAYLREKLHVQI